MKPPLALSLSSRPRLAAVSHAAARQAFQGVRTLSRSESARVAQTGRIRGFAHASVLRIPVKNVPKHHTTNEQQYPSALPILVTTPPPTSTFTTGSNVADAVITAVVGVGILFVGGIAYVAWYKANVLDKIELAFSAGYDPALELANRARPPPNAVGSLATGRTQALDDENALGADGTLRRADQDMLDRIVHGEESGRYFMLLGPKGTGKTTMLLAAMRATHAEGASMCDVHPDPEVFRLRLGKALNYEYHEDSQTGLFQRRDPREGGAGLDIERAFNKLEKVALRYSARTGRPLVLIFNNIHFFRNDDAGREMLLQLQQHAESWAASGIVTMVLSSDDAWPYQFMRKTASRMHVVSVRDLTPRQAMHAARCIRLKRFPSLVSSPPLTPADASTPADTPSSASEIPPGDEVAEAEPEGDYASLVGLLGGRLSYLSQAATRAEMLAHAEVMLRTEQAWLQSVVGLIPDHDDDVMDEQKWSTCSWLLLREFVKMRKEQEEAVRVQIEAGEASPAALAELPLPELPYYRCRQIMTRPDFLEDLDRHNIIAIDIHHNVRPDSLLLLHAAREVVEEDGFDDMLDDVRARVDEIESLHRTRELTFKDVQAGDRIRLTVDKGGALIVESGNGNPT